MALLAIAYELHNRPAHGCLDHPTAGLINLSFSADRGPTELHRKSHSSKVPAGEPIQQDQVWWHHVS